MKQPRSGLATLALVVGHVAGMIDLVALPIWVNTLIDGFRYGPAQAGALPTAFLIGAVIASTLLSRNFDRIDGRLLAPAGFAAAGACFVAVPLVGGFPAALVLHFAAGLCGGTGVSLVHGTMGRTDNPHRTFSYAGIGLGVFAVIFLGGVPQLIAAAGPAAFFGALAGAMFVAAAVLAALMPGGGRAGEPATVLDRFALPVRYAIFGIMGMALVQGMVFSFLTQIGYERGFGAGRVKAVLIALGLVNLLPAAIAALLQHRLRAMAVARIGPAVQAVFALAITGSTVFAGYAVPAVLFAAVMIFTHTFVFGFLAAQDRTGRAVAATPAMLMTGSAIAPFLGGALVELLGFASLGIAATAVAAVSILMFMRADRAARPTRLAAEPAV